MFPFYVYVALILCIVHHYFEYVNQFFGCHTFCWLCGVHYNGSVASCQCHNSHFVSNKCYAS